MPCIAPPELTDIELLAFADRSDRTCGQIESLTGPVGPAQGALSGRQKTAADRDVAGHLARCPHCEGRAARLQAEERHARRLLYRAACPTSDELGEYELRLLEPARARDVGAHVEECSRCRAELATLAEFLTALAPDLALSPGERMRDAVQSRVRMLVAQLLGGGGLAPAYAVRGDAPAPSLYTAEEMQIIVEAKPAAGRAGHYTVLGVVVAPPSGGGPAGGGGPTGSFAEATDYTAHLWRDDLPVNSTPLDPLGNFVFSHLDRGRYDVLITGPKLEIHIPSVLVGGAAGADSPGDAGP